MRLAFELFPRANAAFSSLGTDNNDASTSIAEQQRKARARKERTSAVRQSRPSTSASTFVETKPRRQNNRPRSDTGSRASASGSDVPAACYARAPRSGRGRRERSALLRLGRGEGMGLVFFLFFFERRSEERERAKEKKQRFSTSLALSVQFHVFPSYSTKRAATRKTEQHF